MHFANDIEVSEDTIIKFDEAKYLGIFEEIICTICSSVPTGVVKLRVCPHFFCRECVTGLNNCPTCNERFIRKDIRWTHTYSDIISLRCSLFDLLKNYSSIRVENASEDNDSPIEPKKATQVQALHDYSPEDKKSNDNKNCEKNGAKEISCSNVKQKVISMDRGECSKKNKKTLKEKRNNKGETLLHSACLKKDITKVKSLLEAGADPNVKDFAGWTPLSEAVINGNLELVKLLLENGAWVNTPCAHNSTALLVAVYKNNSEIIEILLINGADINMHNSLLELPLMCAQDKDTIELLMKYSMNDYRSQLVEPNFDLEKTPIILYFADEIEDLDIFENCKKLDFEIYSHENFSKTTKKKWNDLTHLVVEASDEYNCDSSIYVLRALLAGIAVVKKAWLLDCFRSGSSLPVRDYEVDGTHCYPRTKAFWNSRINSYRQFPKLFDGCHISLTGPWKNNYLDLSRQDVITLIQESGAVYLMRDPDPEELPKNEKTCMFHCKQNSPLKYVSHILLYQPKIDPKKEPLLKYNMRYVKTLPASWFLKCIQTFSICDPFY